MSIYKGSVLIASGRNGGSGSISMTSLWTNSSPTSSFASQTLNINTLPNYDFILIEYKSRNNSGNQVAGTSIFRNVVGNANNLNFIEDFIAGRVCKVMTSTQIWFDSTYKGTGSTDNALIIPVEIIGIEV